MAPVEALVELSFFGSNGIEIELSFDAAESPGIATP